MAICKGAYYQLYNIQKVRSSLTKAIQAFVNQRLDYANGLLYGLPNNVMHNLQKVQNSAARTLSGAKRRDHITPVLKKLHWLPVKKRVEFKLLTLMYKVKSGTAPAYLTELVEPQKSSRRLRSEDKHKFVEPSTHLVTGGDRAFQKAGPVLWNKLPLNIRMSPSLFSFKRAVKTYLFRQVYDMPQA